MELSANGEALSRKDAKVPKDIKCRSDERDFKCILCLFATFGSLREIDFEILDFRIWIRSFNQGVNQMIKLTSPTAVTMTSAQSYVLMNPPNTKE